jgi:hypothetical protein
MESELAHLLSPNATSDVQDDSVTGVVTYHIPTRNKDYSMQPTGIESRNNAGVKDDSDCMNGWTCDHDPYTRSCPSYWCGAR